MLIAEQVLFSKEFVERLKEGGKRLALITDACVEKCVVRKLAAFLQDSGLDLSLITFPEGEHHKSRETKQMVEDHLLAQRFGRDTLVLGVGGGVVCDLSGFVAATFARGLELILVPTTVLAMVDASIGGKTAVNTPLGKNLIGAFYPASDVFIDLSLLSSMPEALKCTGCAEILKMALVKSKELFYLMREHPKGWQEGDLMFWMRILSMSCKIKKEVVEQDPQERGLRRILNFGHTVGHAIELLEQYRIPHGEAVAMGMVAESYMSFKLGLLAQAAFEEILEGIRAFSFSFSLTSPIDQEAFCDLLLSDKKVCGQKSRFVLLSSIGSAAPFEGAYCTEVDPTVVQEAMAVLSDLCAFA